MAREEILLTQEGYEKLKKRLEELNIEKEKNIHDIQDARSQGDLSENADYSAARARQGEIQGEIEEIEYKLKNAKIIKVTDENNTGKFVTVKFLATEDMEESVETYQLVGSTESDPLNGKISVESPLGKAILTAKVGETVLVRTDDDRFDVQVVSIKKK